MGKASVVIAIVGLLVASSALGFALYDDYTEPYLELEVQSTHDSGMWVKVVDVNNLKFSELDYSHTTARLWVENDFIYKNEMWFVEAHCGTMNIYTVMYRTGLESVMFQTDECKNEIDLLAQVLYTKPEYEHT